MEKLEEYFRTRVSEEAYDFFAVFSRFEYALKKGGFRRKSKASPDWETFARSLPGAFYEKVSDAEEASIYFRDPPKHLEKGDNQGVKWSKLPQTPDDAHTLFKSLNTARNNLFHGDKKHDDLRDRRLMQAGLYVLNTAYDYACQEKEFSEFIAEMAHGL